MSDQATDKTPEIVSPPTGLEDYFETPEVDQTDQDNVEKVNSDQTEEKTGEDETKENNSESDKSDDLKTEDKKTTGTDTKKEEDDTSKKDNEEGAQSTEYEVAGQKYSSLDEAISAVNRISGDNTRLSGDLKASKKEKLELESKLENVERLLTEYKNANEEWQKYYDGDGERPDVTPTQIQEIIDKRIKEIRSSEKNLELKVKYDEELDEVLASDDFKQVEPFFSSIIDEYEGTKNPPSPKKLYERARLEYKNSLGDNELKDIESVEKLVNERVKKELAKKEAAKTKANAGGSGSDKSETKAPPGTEDYFEIYNQ